MSQMVTQFNQPVLSSMAAKIPDDASQGNACFDFQFLLLLRIESVAISAPPVVRQSDGCFQVTMPLICMGNSPKNTVNPWQSPCVSINHYLSVSIQTVPDPVMEYFFPLC